MRGPMEEFSPVWTSVDFFVDASEMSKCPNRRGGLLENSPRGIDLLLDHLLGNVDENSVSAEEEPGVVVTS